MKEIGSKKLHTPMVSLRSLRIVGGKLLLLLLLYIYIFFGGERIHSIYFVSNDWKLLLLLETDS